jgi:hypothetical protein
LEQVFDNFSKYSLKIGERIFSNWQLGMRVYDRIVMIIVLE